MVDGGAKKGPSEPELYAHANIPLEAGTFLVRVFSCAQDPAETILISQGDLGGDDPVFVRLHSECFTGEALGSLKCDCRYQLDAALIHIAKQGRGAVLYLRQEGRGIGLGNKIRAYHLQEQGLNTIEANQALGFANDLRDFATATKILRGVGVRKVILNTNNPDKIQAIKDANIELIQVAPSLAPVNPHNHDYLKVKHQILGHHLASLFPQRTDEENDTGEEKPQPEGRNIPRR